MAEARRTSDDPVVSSEAEQLILVDPTDREIGFDSKLACHNGFGVLHRAFSLFVFNDSGELLLQQRSASKRLWPLFWSNSCCSHPRRGETMEEAIHRRLAEELGLTADLNFVYKFQYQAQYDEDGAENELCWVYTGRARGEVSPNGNEIEAWRFVTREALVEELAEHPERFTPWFKMEWKRLTTDFPNSLS